MEIHDIEHLEVGSEETKSKRGGDFFSFSLVSSVFSSGNSSVFNVGTTFSGAQLNVTDSLQVSATGASAASYPPPITTNFTVKANSNLGSVFFAANFSFSL